ncbi:MAG: cytosine permease [Spirochaetes bacterium]|nr:cytosine permease [Spirochaetota bacterium]
MADVVNVVPKGYTENPDLMPIARSQQKYGGWTWMLMMFSMNTCIPMFFLGPIGQGLGLNFWQALWGSLFGNFFAVVVMWLNGVVGVRHGLTYPVQLRTTFGFRGTHIPVVMRGLAGLVWFGIEAWTGSLAITMIIVVLTGVPKDMVTATAIKYLIIALVFYMGSFILVMLFGLQGIGKMANWAGPVMLVYFIWLVFWLLTQSKFKANVPSLWVSKAGYLSLPFMLYLAVQTNWWATVALNISDISRGINPAKKGAFGTGLFVGIVLCQMLGTALGFTAAALTGTILPQQIIVEHSPGLIPALIGLLFAFLAPWSTDMTANSIPLFNILMSSFKLRWKPAVIIGTIIAFFVTPWWYVTKGQGIVDLATSYAGNYGILLGPIAGLMIANYWVAHKQKINMQDLYTKGSGTYWYSNGWSIAAFVSLVLTWVLCYVTAFILPDLMAYITIGSVKIPFPGGVIWYFSVVYAFILEIIFTKVFKEAKPA